MEYLVRFQVDVPAGTLDAEIERRRDAEAAAAADLATQGHIARIWAVPGDSPILGLYRADDRAQLDAMLQGLPLYDWMRITVTPLSPHPNDPARAATGRLPEPRLTLVYRLEAALGEPLDLGEVAAGHRRIVALTGGTFAGPDIRGVLVPGASADWQVGLEDGTALGDIRYTLRTDGGDLLYVRSRSVRHGSAEVLARLGRGEDVDPGEYVFRAATEIETAAPGLDWLNKGVFVTVGGRRPKEVVYETYLAG
ncbi:muconolactone Delta-isomerase family protein [Actinomadura sp. WMMA1423]|uniref:muconolactone Delta-isomerase family protein n=1 Tax=Actinomadura sp. WMMA1423 TaxID=2591108 RepID=UPI001147A3BC|nr:muconolactone Delta-isomerase family protein [Actinomadura sp. WMMA1423]